METTLARSTSLNKATTTSAAGGAAKPPAAQRHAQPLSVLPLAAVMLAGSMNSWAQTQPTAPVVAPAGESTPDKMLKAVVVKEKAEIAEGKDSLRATTSSVGKGNQALRDIPQSITVVTEKLIADRNLDTVKEVLHSTAGVTFLAAEGGEEDIRLRGFSLAATGDIFVDGMRDPAFYDRDTFNNDRVELLRGSASMLFGRGSTGGAVNQVNKLPRLVDEKNVALTIGSHNYGRVVGELNFKTGEDAALRVSMMGTRADNNGSGSSINKSGVAAAFRWGIGERHEFLVGLYHVDNENGMNYGIPWLRQRPAAANGVATSAELANTTIVNVDPSRYYGANSDYNHGAASYATASHTLRFDADTELKTVIRPGHFNRDQRASAIRFANTTVTPGVPFNPISIFSDNISDAAILTRGINNKIQQLDTVYGQSDFSKKFAAWGMKHEVLAGIDVAQERFKNFNASTSAALTKPRTRLGTPDDDTGVDESQRLLTVGRTFKAEALGVYAQDLIHVAPSLKLLLGLRHDNFRGRFWSAPDVVRERSDALWSKRFGLLFQPSPTQSFHLSYGTSFNTSGDTYQYDNQTVNTPPEGSVNYELGAKIDTANKQFTTRVALFYSIKNNERNRDPDSAATANLLSGKRHSAGFELDLTGRITPKWEVYGSYAWTPIAKIDVGAPGSIAGVGEGAGTRSSLTPKHSGTVWTTYQVTPKIRVGGGLNYRSEQTPNRNPGWAAAGFVTGDLLAEYAFNDDYKLKANISNVAGKRYADALYTGHYIPGTGRLFQLQWSAKF
jgi:catecholate siderophore receptor